MSGFPELYIGLANVRKSIALDDWKRNWKIPWWQHGNLTTSTAAIVVLGKVD